MIKDQSCLTNSFYKGRFTSVQYIVRNIEQYIVDNCQQLCTSIVHYCAPLFAILI